MTGDQCRAARALLRLRGDTLAENSGYSLSTIRMFETGAHVPMPRTIRELQKALEAEGVVFVSGDAQAGPGVRLRAPAEH